MKDCLFCKIKDGLVDSYKIYEDDIVIAILDAYPDVDGHTLIIPKKHYTDYQSIDDKTLVHINQVAKKLGVTLMEKFEATGLAMMVNYGDRQVIKHFHLHLLPDYKKKKASLSSKEAFEKFNS